MMANRYEQFLGARPGIVVDLLDDSTSPYRVRTDAGFEFSIGAEDFHNYYRKIGTGTPAKWSHLLTDRDGGYVDSNKMAEVIDIIRCFEGVFQDFDKARLFVGDAVRMLHSEPHADLKKLKSWLERSDYDSAVIDDEKLKRLMTAGEDVRAFLMDDSCAVVRLPTGGNDYDHDLSPTPGDPTPRTKQPGKTAAKASTKPRRAGMKNADMQVEGDILTVTVDLSKELGPSKSGKTTIVATSEGNKTIPGREERIGLNIYRQESKKPARGRKAAFKNVEMGVDDDILTLTIDLSKELGPSKSGKTIIVASTGGNQLVLGREEKIGLNVYKKID
ncbi:MAG: hypothetical protein RDU20_17990 [Desulfomonilaceae bacterium]|nr:hypothetical protein [Desulfomonilaceae bacterium]